MRNLAWAGVFVVGIACASLAVAQDAYVPALGDVMTTVQWRHIKLWFAGKRENWDLASYELRQIKASLEEAVVFYRGIPVELVDATVDPIRGIDAAIKAKDGARFAKSYSALNDACNACHVGTGRSFIVIQTPTSSPFSDQLFAPIEQGTRKSAN
jgi:hypothetical protein